jgi:hypothetical protein
MGALQGRTSPGPMTFLGFEVAGKLSGYMAEGISTT